MQAGRLPAITPDLAFIRAHAKAGEHFGMVPYRVADRLAPSLLSAGAFVSAVDKRPKMVHPLGAGGRRDLALVCPALVTVGLAAPLPRVVTFGCARRGRIEAVPKVSVKDPWLASIETRLWRACLGVGPDGASLPAEDRLIAAMGTGAGHEWLRLDAGPAEAATAVRAQNESAGAAARPP